MPPFVGAVAMQLIFGRNGTVNLLLRDTFGFTIPFMDGLNGVILVQSIHYFPFILINLSTSLRNIDSSMEEAAQNLGSHGMRLVPPDRVSAGHAGLCRRCGAGVHQGLRRPRHPPAAECQQHAGPAGLSANLVDRDLRPDGLCDLGHPGGVFDSVALGLVPRHARQRLLPPSRRAAAAWRSAT